MSEIKIFIDYAISDEGKDFVKTLKNQILKSSKNIKIKTFEDIVLEYEDDSNHDYWVIPTYNSIKESTIIIPLITDNYIAHTDNSFQELFMNIIDSSDKFLFPIIFRDSSWEELNWVVRSKLTPENGKPILDSNLTDRYTTIKGLVKTISNIVNGYKNNNDQPTPSEVLKPNKVVFISHDHDDADFAENIKFRLEKENIECWIDSERLKIGQDWREEIDTGIENSLAIIAVMTPESRKSEYVTYEWAYAWGKEKKIFPLMLKKTALHPRLESLQFLDFTNRVTRPWDDLIDSIKKLL